MEIVFWLWNNGPIFHFYRFTVGVIGVCSKLKNYMCFVDGRGPTAVSPVESCGGLCRNMG